MDDLRCTAPKRGHHTLASAVACPAHREQALRDAAHDVQTTQVASIQPVERRMLAADPSTQASMLELLATDTARSVRLLVARNPATPAATVAAMVGDHDAAVAQVAASRARELAER
ncbi:hypothetical protein QQX13_07670 [Demequina sp. SYSU T00068]|uniref:hypothetical protein n=1 Tax=Demequina lignilytica TaxID=3051663 RepID=UPI0026310C6D|nr:hypothetical protein [Demequina sp. SYSU T00068]MDN4490709.1 hypothetical protein [Demequina sp. SYSU T00068]